MTEPANEKPGGDLQSLWDQGTPLNEAMYHYGDQTMVERCRALGPEVGKFGVALAVFTKAFGRNQPLPPGFDPDQMGERFRLQGDLERELWGRLYRGEFFVLGFAVPRKIGDKPCQVPADLLANLNFERATAESHGLRIEGIRVLPRALALPPADRAATPQRGRPSEKAVILAAYEACQQAGLIDFGKPQLRAIEAIQRWLQLNRSDHYGNGRGFGAEAIRQTIAEDFRSKAAKTLG